MRLLGFATDAETLPSPPNRRAILIRVRRDQLSHFGGPVGVSPGALDDAVRVPAEAGQSEEIA